MSKPHQYSENAIDKEQSLPDLAWAIAMSEGQFSLILAHCNYAVSHEHIVQRLRKNCPVEIREIVLDKSLAKLYSTIREQLKDEQPGAVMIFGLESLNNIDQVLTAMNQVREEFRKSFPFPLVFWINDEILKKLIRLAPDFENWATIIQFASTDNEMFQSLQPSADEIVQHQSSEGFSIFNQHSLKILCQGFASVGWKLKCYRVCC